MNVKAKGGTRKFYCSKCGMLTQHEKIGVSWACMNRCGNVVVPNGRQKEAYERN